MQAEFCNVGLINPKETGQTPKLWLWFGPREFKIYDEFKVWIHVYVSKDLR